MLASLLYICSIIDDKLNEDIWQIVLSKLIKCFRGVNKGTLSCLRQFLTIARPLNTIKNAFYFTFKTLFLLNIFKFLF